MFAEVYVEAMAKKGRQAWRPRLPRPVVLLSSVMYLHYTESFSLPLFLA